MRGQHVRRGTTPSFADTLADEWFADFLARCSVSRKATNVLRDWIPRPQDAALEAERAYDAETAELLDRIHGLKAA